MLEVLTNFMRQWEQSWQIKYESKMQFSIGLSDFRKHLKRTVEESHANAAIVSLQYFERLVSESIWKRTGEEFKTNATI